MLYAYESRKVIFNLHTKNQEADIASALELVAYLRKNVNQDAMTLKSLLNRITNTRNVKLLAALPHLPKNAVKSRHIK